MKLLNCLISVSESEYVPHIYVTVWFRYDKKRHKTKFWSDDPNYVL